jgi:hypothetical protein
MGGEQRKEKLGYDRAAEKEFRSQFGANLLSAIGLQFHSEWRSPVYQKTRPLPRLLG